MQIRIDTAQASEAGRRIAAEGKRLQEIGYELRRAVNSLDTHAWDGTSRARAEPMLGQVRPKSEYVAHEIQELGYRLIRVAAIFEQKDNTAAQDLTGLPWIGVIRPPGVGWPFLPLPWPIRPPSWPFLPPWPRWPWFAIPPSIIIGRHPEIWQDFIERFRNWRRGKGWKADEEIAQEEQSSDAERSPTEDESKEEEQPPKQEPEYETRYDGKQPAPGMDSTYGKPGQLPLDAPVTSDPNSRSSGLYQDVINQFAVGNNPRYTRDQHTYCNTFAGDVARAMGVPLPQKREFDMNPKDQATIGFPQLWQYFTDPNAPVKAVDAGWRSVSKTDLGTLESHVNAGKMAVVVNNGHIAVVKPGQQINSFEDINIAQAGATCSNDLTLSQGFGSSGESQIFIIN